MPERDRPLMIPEVTVCCRPKGLPMATTKSPTSALAESPSATCDSPSGLTLRTATSERSEEHTSELQSQSNLVCRLLLEKKKKKKHLSRDNIIQCKNIMCF